MVRACERGNEPLSSVKGGEFIDLATDTKGGLISLWLYKENNKLRD
jgi:hypothetical protein